MRHRLSRLFTALLALALITAGNTAATGNPEARTHPLSAAFSSAPIFVPKSQVKNVILFIGDGLGDAQLTLARNYALGAGGRFEGIDALDFTGSYTTYSLQKSSGKPDYTTDSAASATGWSTGVKTYDGAIGVDLFGNEVQSLVEAAKAAGLHTGVVTTDQVQGATPAAELAHVTKRSCTGPSEMSACPGEISISEQIVTTRADLTLGGGAKLFSQQTRSGTTVRQQAQAAGYQVVTNAVELAAVTQANQSKPLLGLFASGVLPTVWKQSPATVNGSKKAAITCKSETNPRISLAAMTQKSIDLLGSDGAGFFLQVEGASIDKQSHAGEPCGQIGETLDLDAAVKTALDFATTDDHTLVILTADHGHSSQFQNGSVSKTKSLTLKSKEGQPLYVSYNSATSADASQQHSGTQLRIAASGPGAAYVTGITDQTDLHASIRELLKLPPVLSGTSPVLSDPGGAYRRIGNPEVTLAAATIPVAEARNVILITAPGIGDSEITMARDYEYGAHGELLGIDALPFTGQLTTYSLTKAGKPDYVSSIAAAVSALSTGVKTTGDKSGVDHKGKSVRSLIKDAEERGIRTGLISTDSAFTKAAGFTPSLIKNVATKAASSYSAKTAKIGGFKELAGRCSPYSKAVDFGALTTDAINSLNHPAGAKGFFLQIGTTAVAKAGNKADPCSQIGATLNTDRALRAALAFAAKDRKTLVIFTGGLATSAQIVDSNPYAAPSLRLRTNEGADLGVLYAQPAKGGNRLVGSQVFIGSYGPGAAVWLGLHDNTEIATQIRRVFANTAPAPTKVAASTINLNLAQNVIKKKSKATLNISVSAAGQAPVGKVVVTYKKAGKKAKTKTAVLTAAMAGKTTLTLPKLAKGSYQLWAKYSGTKYTSPVTSVKRTLKVK